MLNYTLKTIFALMAFAGTNADVMADPDQKRHRDGVPRYAYNGSKPGSDSDQSRWHNGTYSASFAQYAQGGQSSGSKKSEKPVSFDGFHLKDHQGKKLQLSSLKGKKILLAFYIGGCGGPCPIMARNIAQASIDLEEKYKGQEFIPVLVATQPHLYGKNDIRNLLRIALPQNPSSAKKLQEKIQVLVGLDGFPNADTMMSHVARLKRDLSTYSGSSHHPTKVVFINERGQACGMENAFVDVHGAIVKPEDIVATAEKSFRLKPVQPSYQRKHGLD